MTSSINNKQFLRPADVTKLYGLSRATIWRWIQQGKLPEPKRLSSRMVGWPREQLDNIFLK